MNQKNFLYWLAGISAVLLFAHLGLFYADIMEARNFVSAREMTDEGHWIFTTMNNVPRYEKPPLPTWLTAVMGECFGFGNLAALRFPAALSCFLLVMYFYRIIFIFTENRKLAFISALVLVTNFLVIYVGRRANWDIFSYSFMVIGMYYFILALRNTRAFPNYLAAGILFGLSVLSKGPTGPYVLLIPFYIGYVLVNGFPKRREILGILFCAAVTLVIGFSWYLYIYASDPETFIAIMKKEALARENRDVKPFTRYLSFPVQTGIWILYSIVGLIFPMMKHRTSKPKIYMMFFYWTLFALLFLSLVPSKKERYLFPMMVPLAATTGFYLYYIFRNPSLRKWEINLNKAIFSILGLVAIVLSAAVFFLPVKMDFYTVLFAISCFATAVVILYSLYGKRNFERAFFALIFLMLSTGLFGIPIIDRALSNNHDKKSIVSVKAVLKKEQRKLYSYSEYSPEVWFRYQEVIPEILADDPSTYPKENTFYIAVNDNTKENMQKLKKLGWQLQYITKYDDNEAKAPSKNNVGRKIHYLYKVTKTTAAQNKP